MHLRDYVELGIAKTGTSVQLARHLGQPPSAMSDIKANRRGLPIYACIQLAHLIEADPLAVIAASELVTEKKEDRRAILLPLVNAAKSLVFAAFFCDLALKMSTKVVSVIMDAI